MQPRRPQGTCFCFSAAWTRQMLQLPGNGVHGARHEPNAENHKSLSVWARAPAPCLVRPLAAVSDAAPLAWLTRGARRRSGLQREGDQVRGQGQGCVSPLRPAPRAPPLKRKSRLWLWSEVLSFLPPPPASTRTPAHPHTHTRAHTHTQTANRIASHSASPRGRARYAVQASTARTCPSTRRSSSASRA